MNIYSFNNIKHIYVVGDCHGEFKTFFNSIKRNLLVHEEDEEIHPMEIARRERAAQLPPRNRRMDLRYFMPDLTERVKKRANNDSSCSLFIVAGDCGFGFNKPNYYSKILEKYNKIFSYNNAYVVFIRGNHDDPQYFDGKAINLSNIKAVPDYSLIEVNKNKGILCVGGAISVDRVWRKEQEKRVNRFSKTNKKTFYWPNEAPVFNIDAINEITKEHKINYVVSHTCPSFTSIEKHESLDEWCEKDEKLKDDVANERLVMDRIYEALRDSGNRPTYWAYGHFDESFVEKRSDTIFRALPDGFNPILVEEDIKQYIINEDVKQKKQKKEYHTITIPGNMRNYVMEDLRRPVEVALDNGIVDGEPLFDDHADFETNEPDEIEDIDIRADGGENAALAHEIFGLHI